MPEKVLISSRGPKELESLVKTDKKWDEGQVDVSQKWVFEIYLKKRGVHVPALKVGLPKQADKNAHPEK
jgi:hypothetical protein